MSFLGPAMGYNTTVVVKLITRFKQLLFSTLNSLNFFPGWLKTYSEFSKSEPVMSSSCRLYNDNVSDM